MKRLFSIFAVLGLTACAPVGEWKYEPNPDPNHMHADFSVWVDEEQVDFSGPEYMSGLPTDESIHHGHKYLHLHDEIGHVIHRHKPELNLKEFFDSLNYRFQSDREWRMFVNGQEEEFDFYYSFQDMDQILLTTSAGSAQILHELEQLTEDACLYSKTCPWRGEPPTENCIADPEVPCVLPGT